MIDVVNARGFDFHCHIDLDRDPAKLIAKCESGRIVTIAVTTTPKAWPQNRSWTSGSSYVLPALGLHPELVAERSAEVELLNEYLEQARFIGEVGLDGSPPHRDSMPLQRQVFTRILESAERLGNRVVTIHSRAAAEQVIETIAAHTSNERVRCILHWFSGSPAMARLAVQKGSYFSINGQMLSHERGRALVKSLPRDRLLTETDSPFSRTKSGASLPWDVLDTEKTLADLFNMSEQELHKLMVQNARNVLAFAHAV